MLKMNWKFTAIVYTDDDLGRQSADALIRDLLERDICTTISIPIRANMNRDDLKKIVDDLIASQVVSVIYTGSQAVPLRLLGRSIVLIILKYNISWRRLILKTSLIVSLNNTLRFVSNS